LETVNELLEWAKDDNIEPSVFMIGSAIWTDQRCGDLNRCIELYEELERSGCGTNAVVMNGVLSALCDVGEQSKALKFFDQMKDRNFQASAATMKRLVSMIESNEGLSSIEKESYLIYILNRMDAHERQVKIGSPVFEALISKFGSTGKFDEALKVANQISGVIDAPCLRALLLAHGDRWFQAVQLLHASDIVEGSPGPGKIDQIALSHVILSCAKADEFDEALSLLHLYGIPVNELPPGAPSLSIVALNALIAACGRGGSPEISLALLNDMQPRFGIAPDSRSYRSTVIACNQAQHGNKNDRSSSVDQCSLEDVDGGPNIEWWEIALALLRRMKEEGLIPDIHTYSSVISACEAAGQWQRALGVLQSIIDEEASESDAQPTSLNLYCWNAAISACEKGGAWVECCDLYERMLETESFMPNVVTMNSLLEALDNNGQKELAQSKYDEGLELGIVKPWRWTKDKNGEQLLALDLHTFSAAMSRAAIRNVLNTWLNENDSTGGLTSDLVIITGQGLHSRSCPVLQSAAKEVLLEFGIDAHVDEANQGRLIVSIEKLLDCFGNKSWR
jgi:pentatricopeptide repeat domain-containing protein 1